MQQYDVAVIGGGPGGYVAAIKAAQMGKKTCIIEKNKIGGTCLNVGCIPTKALLRSVQALKEVKNSEAFGLVNIDTSKASLDLRKVQERKQSIVKQMVDGVSILLRKNKVEVIQAEAKFINRSTIKAGDIEINANSIIVATGSMPKRLPIKIDDTVEILTSTEALEIDAPLKRIAIIGGGVIGIEFAYFLAGVGTKVTVIEFMDRILPMVDQEITNALEVQLKEMGIDVITNAKVMEIKTNKVVCQKNGELIGVETDKVLMSVGRTPNTEGLDIEKAGIKTERGAIITDEYLRTNIEGIYAIGDINGKSMLAHTASMEGIIAVENICGNNKKMDYSKIPSAIYTQPEIASVGLTEEEARAKYKNIKIGRFPLTANGKAKVEGEGNGLIKVISESKYNEVIGVHIYSIHATDLIEELVLAMNLECTADEIAMSVHPHPTVSEIVSEACHAVVGKAIHI